VKAEGEKKFEHEAEHFFVLYFIGGKKEGRRTFIEQQKEKGVERKKREQPGSNQRLESTYKGHEKTEETIYACAQ